jgi:hypothetical protein
MSDLDPGRVAATTEKIARAVRQHYIDGPPARRAVFEVLNSLATVVAFVLKGTGGAPEAREFFDNALRMNIEDLEGGN